jgi:hypothetical protein
VSAGVLPEGKIRVVTAVRAEAPDFFFLLEYPAKRMPRFISVITGMKRSLLFVNVFGD